MQVKKWLVKKQLISIKMKTNEIINFYQIYCNKIINKFAKKQDLQFDGWVGDDIGNVSCFCGEYYFNLSDIILDLKTKQPKGFILQWQIEYLEFNVTKEIEQHKNINYKSYTMGLRLKTYYKNSNEIQSLLL